MAKDIRDGIEFVDETPVSAHVARFSGTFDVDPGVAQTWVQGDLKTFLVTARINRRTTDPHKAEPGTLKLSNTLGIE